ncbi:MAG: ABC transporter substrate-binding protein [Spirochaetaceae bacterium]|nr:ABC transporter substrate-binding protein [Spirochaetaceae bacterium]
MNIAIHVRLNAFLFVVFAICLSCSGKDGKTERYNTQDARAVTIGVAYPVLAWDKESYYIDGLELAVKKINESGGVLGKPLELLIRDDQGNSRVAQQIAETFHDAGITAVVGHFSSDVCYFVEDIYEEREIVMITPSASSMMLFSNDYEYIYRMVVNNLMHAQVLAEFAKRNGIRRPALFFLEGALGTNLTQLIEEELTGRQITVIDRSTSITPANVGELMYRWRAFGCDALFMASPLNVSSEPIKLLRDAGADIPIFCIEDFRNKTFMNEIAGYTDNLYSIVFSTEDMDSVFLEAFRAAYKRNPNLYEVAGYEAVHLLADAMNAEGSIESGAIVHFLNGLQNHHSAMGSISYNPESKEFDGSRLRVESFRVQVAR